MKHKTKKPPPQQQQQQLPQQSYSASSASQQQTPGPISIQYASQPQNSILHRSIETSDHDQGFPAVRPLTPESRLPQPAISTGSPSPSAAAAAGGAGAAAYHNTAAAQWYGDPSISPRGFSPRETSCSSAAYNSSLLSPTAMSRHPSGALAARIQAAEMSAAGMSDPAIWAAAAAEAVRADKQAAAAAARRAIQLEEERRRQQLHEAAAAALAAGRVTSAVSGRGPSDPGNSDSYFTAPPVARDQQQQLYWQQLQQQHHHPKQQQHHEAGRGWLTPATGSNNSSPAAADRSSTAAAAAAALAAATASYNGRTSPHKDPAQIAAEYVELQRQQHLLEHFSSQVWGAAESVPPGMSLEVQPSLRQQYSSGGTSPIQQQQQQGFSARSHSPIAYSGFRAASPECSSVSPDGSRLQQAPQPTAGQTADGYDSNLGPRALSGSLRSYPIQVANLYEGFAVGTPMPGHLQLPPIRTVPPPQARPVSPSFPGPAYLGCVLPGHDQDPSGAPEQHRAVHVSGDPYQQHVNISPARAGGTPEASSSTRQSQASPVGTTAEGLHRTKQQKQPAVGGPMFVPVQQGSGMIGRLLGVYRTGSTGIVAAAAAGSADVEDGPSGSSSSKHTPAEQTNSRSAAARGAKDAAVVSTQPAKRRKLLLCVVIPLLLVVSAAGIGLGVGLGASKNSHATTTAAAAATSSSERLAFTVTVAVPTDQPAVSCAKWFGSSKLLETYRAVFISSYASALSIPPAAFNISSVQCGGDSMTSPAGLPPPSRHLLAAAAGGGDSAVQGDTGAAANVQQGAPNLSTPTTDVVTLFSVPNPANSTDSKRLITEVETNSNRILEASLKTFFEQPVQVKSVARVAPDSTARAAPAAVPTIAAAVQPTSQHPPASPQPAHAPPPPLRIAVPAPAVPSGVAVILPPAQNKPSPGPAPPLYTPRKPQNTAKQLGAVQSPTSHMLYDTAPNCTFAPTVGNSVMDTEGRLWGWENWQSCAFRDYVSVQAELPASTWQQAPACAASPDSANSVLDADGMPWGWERGQSCAFRPLGWTPKVHRAQLDWQSAPQCTLPGSGTNSVLDSNGHLWGWQVNQSCAFRGDDTEAIRQGRVTWDAAPTCEDSPTLSNSVVDADGQLWGWQDGKSCAFKPAQG